MSETKKLSLDDLRRLAESILLATKDEVRNLMGFMAGMIVASEAYLRDMTVDEVMNMLLTEEALARREEIMPGVRAMEEEIARTNNLLQPVLGTTRLYAVLALKELPNGRDVVGDFLRAGSFESHEAAIAFVESGNLPEDYPYYSISVANVNFYVLGSKEFSNEQIHEMTASGDERWKQLAILSGPHLTAEAAKQSLVSVDKAGWVGIHLGSMTDEDAARLNRVAGSTQ